MLSAQKLFAPRSFIPTWLATSFGMAVLAPSAVMAESPPFVADDSAVFEGHFETRIADMFDGSQRVTHHLVSDSEAIEIDVDPAAYPDLRYDARVRAYGVRLGQGSFEVDWLEVTQPAPEPLVDPTPRSPRRIATLIVHPGTSDDMTAEELTARVYTNEDSTQQFFIENSYGMESFAGEAFGPYTISDPGGCDYESIADSARAAFAADGGNLDDFDQFMYYMPRVSGCGWSGLASVGSPDQPARDSWYNGSAGCTVLAQELAHNYGLMHTRTYINCSGSTFPGPSGCSENEYGSPYDPMGRGCGHTANYQKSYMGWHQECNIVTTQQNATYNLMPTELPCNGTQTLRLPLGDGNFYYLEYRQPEGNFARWEGVLVYYGPEYTGGNNWGGPDGYLIAPTGAEDWFMHAGESYEDYDGRVTFSVVEENPTHAVIQVNYPSGSGSPSCAGGGAPIDGGNGNIGTLECVGSPPADTQPPTVSITAPVDGATFDAPAAFSITADATDNIAVASVELLMNGMTVGIDSAAPWEWSVTDLPEGEYALQAKASDGSNVAMSDTVTVTVGGVDDTDTGDTGGTGDDSTGGDGTGGDGTGGDGTGTGCDVTGGGSGGGVSGGLPPATTSPGFDEDASVGGCGCRQSGSGVGGAAWWSLLAIPVAARRRRRSN